MALDHDIAHAAAVHLANEIGIRDLRGRLMREPGLEQVEQYYQEQGDYYPKREVAAEIAHRISPVAHPCIGGGLLRLSWSTPGGELRSLGAYGYHLKIIRIT